MTYEDFEKFVQERCMYETIYDDSDGRPILVIRLLDAYGMVSKAAAAGREWQGLTNEEYTTLMQQADHDAAKTGSVFQNLRHAIEAKLKEKNHAI